jgi:predicted DNA-binding protein with PD1-like motif
VHLHTITTTGFPTADKYWNFTGPIELGSVQGSVIGGRPRPHRRIRQDSKQTYIGHLEPGSVVAYRAEVSLVVLEGVKTERYNDADGNFRIRQAN